MPPLTPLTIIAALQGKGPTPLSVFCVLAVIGEQVSQKRINQILGGSHNTISKCLHLLKEHGYANQSDYRGDAWYAITAAAPWRPTESVAADETKRHPLTFETSPSDVSGAPDETKRHPVTFETSLSDVSGSSSLILNTDLKQPQPPTPTRETSVFEDSGSPADPGLLAELLTGLAEPCSRRRALEVIDAALSRGASLEAVESEIRRWMAYCKSRAGKGIRNTGAFIASKIEHDEACPIVPREERAHQMCAGCGHARANHNAAMGCVERDCDCARFTDPAPNPASRGGP